MNITRKKKWLKAHGVGFLMNGEGRLIAKGYYTQRLFGIVESLSFLEYEDITDWTMGELYSWLGY